MIAPSDINFATTPVMPATDRGLFTPGSIRALQLGMAWFPEQPGGLDRYYCDLLKRLPEANVRVRGLVCGSSAVQQQSLGAVRSACEGSARLPNRLLALRRCVNRDLAEFDPDVVGAHFALYAFPALGCLKNKPFISHFHGPWHKESVIEGYGRFNCWARYCMERAVYTRADRLITLSDFFRTELVRGFGIDESRIVVIPGGVDVNRFDIAASRTQARTWLGWPLDRPIVLAVRRLTRRMGLENLIQSAMLIRAKCPDVLILIAGAGKLKDELQQQIDALGLGNHVRLLGFLPDADLPLAYRAANLSVVPSISLEGFGLVAAESLAAGTPVVATPVGGLPEIIRPFREHMLARGLTARHLADTIIPALLDMQRLPDPAECSAYARRYDWSVVAAAVGKVFASVI